MKYKIDTKELFTDKGILVKKMQCLIEVNWDEMQPGKNDLERICSHCNKSVLNLDSFSDEEALFVLSQKPDTCVKINAKKY